MVVRYRLALSFRIRGMGRNDKLASRIRIVNSTNIDQEVSNPNRKGCSESILEGHPTLISLKHPKQSKRKNSKKVEDGTFEMEERIRFLDVTSSYGDVNKMRLRVDIYNEKTDKLLFSLISTPFKVLARQRTSTDHYMYRRNYQAKKREALRAQQSTPSPMRVSKTQEKKKRIQPSRSLTRKDVETAPPTKGRLKPQEKLSASKKKSTLGKRKATRAVQTAALTELPMKRRKLVEPPMAPPDFYFIEEAWKPDDDNNSLVDLESEHSQEMEEMDDLLMAKNYFEALQFQVVDHVERDPCTRSSNPFTFL